MPLDFQTKLRGGGNRAASDPAQTKKIADLESRLNATIEERGLHEKAKTHSGYLLDRLLFPGGGGWGGGGRKKKKDPFAILSGSGGWHKNATSPAAAAAAASNDREQRASPDTAIVRARARR
jgi:Mrp family chromosome partitioning ATPase